jgi:hypothetical protein
MPQAPTADAPSLLRDAFREPWPTVAVAVALAVVVAALVA